MKYIYILILGCVLSCVFEEVQGDDQLPPVTVVESDQVVHEKKVQAEADAHKAALLRLGTKLDSLEERFVSLMGKMEEMEQRITTAIKDHVAALTPPAQPTKQASPQGEAVKNTASLPTDAPKTEDAAPGVTEEVSLSAEMSKLSPEEAYQKARSFVSAGDYEKAIEALETFLEIYKDHPLAQPALYWIAETHFVKHRYAEASKKFLQSYQKDQKGNKAPDALLKLGMSMARLKKQKEACATFKKLAEDFPIMNESIKKVFEREKKALGCGVIQNFKNK